MIPLYTADEMRRMDRYAIDVAGIPGAVLMEAAGRSAFFLLREVFGDLARGGTTLVVCGTGNNGGDGFVVARCLLGAGLSAEVVLVGSRKDVRGDAAIHLNAFAACGGRLREAGGKPSGAARKALEGAALVVDALFGTGLSRPVAGAPAAWIEAVNRRGVPVVALDLPSGLCADTGNVLGDAIRARLTVTFGQCKRGLFLHPGAAYAGRVERVDIGIPPTAAATPAAGVTLVEEGDFAGVLKRPRAAHKGLFGHVVLLAGGRGKMGAASLAATAALRAGAGLVTAAFPGGLLPEARFLPEVMIEALPGAEWTAAAVEAALPLLARADAVVAGPGMGLSPEAQAALARLLAAKGLPPLVLDADALTHVSGLRVKKLDPRTILTPHPGEASRLLGVDSARIQADRPDAARLLAKKYGCVAILKGAGTLVAAPGEPLRLVARGNPGMATAGSGDVLSGVAGAFAARGLAPATAAAAAAFVHAVAGDRAAERLGEDSLVASDISDALSQVLRALSGAPTPPQGESA